MAQLTFKKYKDSTTGIQTYEQAETCSLRHKIALLRSDTEKSVTVKADAPLSITMGVDKAVIPVPIGFIALGCNPTVTFVPKSGTSYTAELVSEHGMCSIKVMQINSDRTASDVPADSVRIRKWKRGFDEGSSFCD
ncbi:hypothetical protein C9I57_17060 [Trinickia symbiotica]|uniref:Uncharacterized protein n=1 Tax=Trinickia symbiotica TaxID=863227 RepID=A0A2T3XSB1_9BURK|nr:hypothetical protein C9I57_17060 [Trinickia symbiotica]